MDAVGGDDDVAFDNGAVGKHDAGARAVLFETGAAVSGMNDFFRQRARQDVDQVGAVHAEGRVPARGIGDLHRRDRRAVITEIA